jgi:general secretion pathway protein J
MSKARRLSSGFTLVEVLLATMLLAAGLALAFATLRAAGATAQRGEAIAARNERIRAASEFLRRRIGSAQGIVFELDPSSGASLRFSGDAQRMRFVADLPDYLGRGGPHLHELAVVRSGDGSALQVDFRMVLAGATIDAGDARPPERLADGLRSVQFAYRTLGKRGLPGPWLYEWAHPDALPLQVRVRIADAQGAWPDMVANLPMAASYGAAPEAAP